MMARLSLRVSHGIQFICIDKAYIPSIKKRLDEASKNTKYHYQKNPIMNTPYNVQEKVTLVTGANRGIGKAIVDSLIQAGVAKVYAAVRNLDSVQFLVAEYGDKIQPIEIELSKPETIRAAAAQTNDVNIVINNAGVLKPATVLNDEAIETLEFHMQVNVYGLINMAQAFAPALKLNGGGALVQLNSIASLKNFPDFATYAASKAASYSITQALKDNLKAQGTRVLSVHPGPIATDMAKNAGFEEISEPASLVGDGIVEALKTGEPHLFPDAMAKEFWGKYEPFARNVVEADTSA